MKKLILLPLVAIFALTVSCERDSIVTPDPPNAGVWDELVWVRLQDVDDTTSSATLISWAGILSHADRIVGLSDTLTIISPDTVDGVISFDTTTVVNDLRLMVREVRFMSNGPEGTMRITTRFLGGLDASDPCVAGNVGGVAFFSEEFMVVEYRIEPGHAENVGLMEIISAQFTGSDFTPGSINPECTPTVFPEIQFQFSYQQAERNTMNFYEIDANDGSFRSIHFLRFRQQQ